MRDRRPVTISNESDGNIGASDTLETAPTKNNFELIQMQQVYQTTSKQV